MAQKSENKLPKKTSSTTPQDVALLRLHAQFDEISDVLVQDCYMNHEVQKALDLMKFARFYTAEVFKKFVVQ